MAARYQASMLRSLKEVQGDDNVVGFYQATALGAFFNQTLVDTQAIHQERLRHGGIVIVHGELVSPVGSWQGLMVGGDVSQAVRGHASFRAFRLTPAFMDAYKRGNFSSARWVWRWPGVIVFDGLQPDGTSAGVFIDPGGDSGASADKPSGKRVHGETCCAGNERHCRTWRGEDLGNRVVVFGARSRTGGAVAEPRAGLGGN